MLPVLLIGLSLASFYIHVSAYHYEGCYRDSLSKPLFNGLGQKGPYINLDLSIETCVNYCANDKFTYMAVQNGNMCFCSDILPTVGASNNTDCDVRCLGNRFQECGGVGFNSVYTTYPTEQTTPSNFSPKLQSPQILAGTGHDRSLTPLAIGEYCLIGIILFCFIVLFVYTWKSLRKRPIEESKEGVLNKSTSIWQDMRSLGVRLRPRTKGPTVNEAV